MNGIAHMHPTLALNPTVDVPVLKEAVTRKKVFPKQSMILLDFRDLPNVLFTHAAGSEWIRGRETTKTRGTSPASLSGHNRSSEPFSVASAREMQVAHPANSVVFSYSRVNGSGGENNLRRCFVFPQKEYLSEILVHTCTGVCSLLPWTELWQESLLWLLVTGGCPECFQITPLYISLQKVVLFWNVTTFLGFFFLREVHCWTKRITMTKSFNLINYMSLSLKFTTCRTNNTNLWNSCVFEPEGECRQDKNLGLENYSLEQPP